MFVQWTSLGLVSKGTFERIPPKARSVKTLHPSLRYQDKKLEEFELKWRKQDTSTSRFLSQETSWTFRVPKHIVPPQSRSCASKPITIELAGARHCQGAFLWLNSRNSRRALRQMLRHLIIVPFKCVSSWNFHEHRFPIKGICDRLGYYLFPGSFWRCSREWQSIWLLHGRRRVTISYKVLQIISIAPGNEKIQKLLFSLPVQKFS